MDLIKAAAMGFFSSKKKPVVNDIKESRVSKDEGKPNISGGMAEQNRQPKAEKVQKNIDLEKKSQVEVKASSTGRTQDEMVPSNPKSVEISKSQDEFRDPSNTNLKGEDPTKEKEEILQVGEGRQGTQEEDTASKAGESVETGSNDGSFSGDDDSTTGLSVLNLLEDESCNDNETAHTFQEPSHTSHCNSDTTELYKKAEEHFKKGEYQDAGKLYQKILPLAKNEKGQNNKIIGDIHVKLAAAYQSKGKLRASVDHLMLARGVYESIVEGNGENNGNTPNLESKIIEIMKTVASLQVATEQVEDADKSYRSVIKACKKYYENDRVKLAEAINNYGNFQSVCQSKDNLALETFKKALKVLTQHQKIRSSSASTLNNMGLVYLRLSKASNGSEGQKDAKRAEACFLKSLQLYRKSISTSGYEKITEVSFNLAQARLWQQERKGILRNVRFGETVLSDTYDSTSRDDSDVEDSQDSLSDGTYSFDDDETFDDIKDGGCFAFCY